MNTILFLVLFPLLVAAVLLLVRNDALRSVITCASAAIIALASIILAACFMGSGVTYIALLNEGAVEAFNLILLAVDVALAVYVVVKSAKYRRWLPLVLAAVQALIIVIFEFTVAAGIDVDIHLYIDNLNLIMALIIGIIGSGICVYAIGYMRDFAAHLKEGEKDRRPVFFALMFAFLSAMFLLVFSNSLLWMLTAWEITTVCSFALIGYTRTEEAINNSFRQIWMNLIGGLAFVIAIVLLACNQGILELDKLIEMGVGNAAFLLPLALLALAACTKAAQAPFHSWLLGAMVAPTPTSALLHSSTMVKAGVFLLIKLAPCMGDTVVGAMVIFVGALTFLLCSCMAISQSNAKRVLAYSTIANLGLIAACAGVGTPEAVWAAVFLLIFHACAKSLLFLCVGTAEHHIGSRNIEDMDYLFERMPSLARLMLLGIMVMFIAPFGMLISKWAAFQSFIDSGNVVLILMLAFGSAATFFFWAKWMGKLVGCCANREIIEGTVHKQEWISMGVMAALAAACSVLFPIISKIAVVPYIESAWFSAGCLLSESSILALGYDNLWIVAILALFLCIVMIALPKKGSKQELDIYMAGANVDNEQRLFRNSFSQPEGYSQRNWYMEEYFGEDKLNKFAVSIPIVLFIFGILVAAVIGGGF